MSLPDQDQRTVKPSPKRIADFRKRGEAARSRDLVTVLTMAGAAIAALLFARPSMDSIRALCQATLGNLHGPTGAAIALATRTFLGCALPAGVGALAGFFLSGLQLGWPPVWKMPGFKLPFSVDNITKIVSPKAALGRVAHSAINVAAVGGAAAIAVVIELRDLTAAPPTEPARIGGRIADAAGRLGLYAGGALLLLAIIDFVRKKRELAARMRMTPQEAKREHREQDGDPHIKRRRKQRMREIARRRIAAAVKTADVVVVNPTHYAVALRYSSKKERAPRVVAKGTDEVAARIRTLARQAGVPILSRPPLARMLHKLVPEGKEIPGALYKAVAEVLAYVYRLRRRAG